MGSWDSAGRSASSAWRRRRLAGRHLRAARGPGAALRRRAALALLPESVRRERPWLALAEAHALVQCGRPVQARQVAEAVLEHGGRTGSVSVQVRALVELGNIARYTGDADAAQDWLTAADHLLRAAGLPDHEHRLLEGRLLGLRGVCAAVSGQMDVARDALESAERVLMRGGTTRELAVVQY